MSNNNEVNMNSKSSRSYVITLLFAFFLGCFGIHRFYTGYVWIGVVQLLTGGGFGLWALIDLISLALNKYVDADGKELDDPNSGCGLLVLLFVIITFIIGGINSISNMFLFK